MRTAYWISLLCLAAPAQEGGTRQLWNTEFLKERAPAKKTAVAAKTLYRPVSKAAGPAPGAGLMVGVTVWRLRPAVASDAGGARILVLGSPDAMAAERIEPGTRLKRGDRVRVAVEAPRSGFLYVIDREQYKDGKLGAPYLIYPNRQARDNAVAPGRLIEIPGQSEPVPYFTIQPSRPEQTGEMLTLLLTPTPLEDVIIGEKALQLSAERYAEWEKRYGVEPQRFEMDGGAGQVWTAKEKKAGGDNPALLTQDDPLPQTLYRVPAVSAKPILWKVLLKM